MAHDWNMKENHTTKNLERYIAALKEHKAKIASGKRTNRRSLWRKELAAIREIQAGPIPTQAELDGFRAMTEAAAK